MSTTIEPLLAAATPQEWITQYLNPHLIDHDRGVDETTRAWLTVEDLFANDSAHLRASHHHIRTEDHATPAAAAKWLTGWYPGRTAHAAGYLYAYASAGIIIDPQRLRFGRHPDGYTQLVDFGPDPRFIVLDGHPWTGQPGVTTASNETDVASAVLSSLVAFSRPVLDAIRRYARVGLVPLWSEVADEFVLAATSHEGHAPHPTVVQRVTDAIRVPGTPWRKYPEIWIAQTANTSVLVGQKGGCCLAYLCEPPPGTEPAHDPEHQAWLQKFPPDDQGRSYCTSCSLLDRGDSEARQLYHLNQ